MGLGRGSVGDATRAAKASRPGVVRAIRSGSAASASAGRACGAFVAQGAAGLADHLRHRQPGLDQGEVGLGVEEHAPGVAVRGRPGCSVALERGEVLGAVGQVEDVAVPVQDGRARARARRAAGRRGRGPRPGRSRAPAPPPASPRPRAPAPAAARRGRCRAPAARARTASASHSRSAASAGKRSTSSTFIGPPMTTAPATSSCAGSGWPASGLTVCTSQAAAGVEDAVRPLPGHVLDRQQGGTLVHAHRRRRLAALRLRRCPSDAGSRSFRARGLGRVGDAAPQAPRRDGDRRARGRRRGDRRLRDRPAQRRPPGDRQAPSSASSRSRSWRSAG